MNKSVYVSTYMYIHLHIYVCVCVCVCVCVFIYSYVYTYIYVAMSYFIFRLIAHEEYETFPSPKEWLDRAKIRYGGKYTDKEVDDIKRVFNTFPVWLFLIVYFTLVSQVRFHWVNFVAI